ncbi:Uncharacterized conserved protein [Cohaesibacter sp. ES.047]|uniref:exopolysaccharide biosynthesis protein n=1 Tax=Cohaesibacter sp. ES.047 TaxID=1798205 RepID=UPI000BBF76FA|nr:exopolysaccharide biosynthesis protein [Cohaesibacter sp. ES.047]SNY92723.1 Uncharacterized conserved protein [Cohaesibacter sp. ES.047]
MSDQSTKTTEQDASVVSILEQTNEAANGEKTSVGEAMDTLGAESYVALILVPALLAVSPLSGIPTASSFLGITIALVSFQALLGREQFWFPGWLLRRKVDTEKFRSAMTSLQKPAGYIDRFTKKRFSFLVQPPARTLMKLVCMLCGLTMPFMELIPFSSSILGAAVSLLATALIVRDGLLAVLGLLILSGAAVAVLFLFL